MLERAQLQHDYASTIVRVADLSASTIDAMAALYLDNYDGSSQTLFRSDLAEKDEAILLTCKDVLVGFTALKFLRHAWNGVPVRVVYSGDTIVSPAHWGQQKLAFSWISRVGRFRREEPSTPLYWLLLVKGHRTYRYLPAFSKTFFPHWSAPREDLKPLADQLAAERFGADYNAARGVVEFPRSRGHLREAIAVASPEELAKPSVQFFFERNPGYREGHELVCMCELDTHNLKPLAARLFEKDLAHA